MNSKTKILFVILLKFNIVVGQNARLGVFNPSPRLGDIITIDFTITDTSAFKDNNDNVYSLRGLNKEFNGEGSVSIKKLITSTGKYSVGPFSFIIAGKTYTSNTIELNVDAKLPNEPEGIWIRQVKWNNNEYIIIEQRIDLSTKSNKKNKKVYNNFVGIGASIWNIPNLISFTTIGSSSLTQPTEENQRNVVVGEKPVIYQISIYSITKGKDFKGIALTKQNLDNFPGNSSFSDFMIK